MKFGIVLLAAGGSSRMGGQHKLLLPWGERTVIGQSLANAQAAGTGAVVVVLGARAAEVQAACPGASFVVNDQWASGMYGSVLRGIAALPGDTDAFFVALGDMPLVPPSAYAALMEVYRGQPERIYIPTYEGRRGHPVLFPMSLAPQAPAEVSDAGLRGVIQANGARVVEVPVPYPGVCIDVDTPEEYERNAPARGESAPGTRKRWV
ncbi:MAG TPA: nucleotidyltransferase family protein [Symbiobacteriaceae bacterium]|nr:nucleotidyltransferase family protein [Symbiobacteriaceae bacterium]